MHRLALSACCLDHKIVCCHYLSESLAGGSPLDDVHLKRKIALLERFLERGESPGREGGLTANRQVQIRIRLRIVTDA